MYRGSAVSEFLERYRRAFAAFDAEAIADMFAYPCQLTSDESEMTTVSTREAWLPQVKRLVAAYRAIGVHAAEILELQVTELTRELAQAVVHWALVDGAGTRIYEFNAAYTLADLSQGLRITAIAHNETPRLRAAIGARQREASGRRPADPLEDSRAAGAEGTVDSLDASRPKPVLLNRQR